ncbi:MAG: succinate dehydrogenase cytochrome b subunit [Bdellovibrio sp.]
MIIFRKIILALTGLFICIFLIAHLGANLLLLLPEEQARQLYNNYSATLRGNPVITAVAYLNYACILFHVIYALIITRQNKICKGPTGIKVSSSENSTWTSQNMALLGSILLAFIIVHMANFWFKVKIQGQDEDLYQMVVEVFKSPFYIILYVVAMLPLSLHLAHGVQSAFQSLGLYHKKYLRWVARAGVVYAWFVGIGFAVIPLIVYFR